MRKNHKNILFSVLLVALTLGLNGCSCSQASKPSKELAPGLYLGKLTVDEGNSNGTTTVTLDVTLQRENSDSVSVDYIISAVNPDGRDSTELAIVDDGSVSTTGYDVVQSAGSITFLPTEPLVKQIQIQIFGDTIYEHDEVFLVTLSNPTAGVDIVTESVEVKIANDDEVPVVSFSADNNDLVEIFSGKNDPVPGDVSITLSLDKASRIDSIVTISSSIELAVDNARANTKVGETAAYRVDYLLLNDNVVIPSNEIITIPAGSTELVLNLEVVDDGYIENKEQFFLNLVGKSDVIEDITQAELEFFISDNDTLPAVNYVPLNDTGVVELVTFSQPDIDLEIDQEIDGNIGLDADTGVAKIGNGRAGFDYTKIDSNGNDVDVSVQISASQLEDGTWLTTIPWDCVRDNISGLVWEVKTRGSVALRAEARELYWYDPNFKTNGGDAGYTGFSACSDNNKCSTSSYVADMNHIKLCGMTGWRLPTIEELRSLIDYGVDTVDGLGAAPEDKRTVAYDTDFFIGDLFANKFVWSSTTDSSSPARVRTLRFNLSIGLLEDSRVKNKATLNMIRVVNDSLTRNQ